MKSNFSSLFFTTSLSVCLLNSSLFTLSALSQATEATEATKEENQRVRRQLPFSDTSDFERVQRGFIGTIETGEIKGENGNTVFNMKQFEFIQGEAPDTANPSLWRQSQLNAKHGLFKVTDDIYQIRGFDLANMSMIRGKTGWIIVDPLTSTETAAAGLKLLREKVEDLPVSAVIITHSHVDHFGGVKGVVDEKETNYGTFDVIAPVGFFKESVDENLIAGNAMSRRASYMYGNVLPKSPTGTLGSGLGTTTSSGTVTILEPTIEINQTPQQVTVDGIEMIFMNTPGAEAPAELMFYIPSMNALCQAEEINHTLHNLYTLRGAKVRNGLVWSKYIHQTIELFGDEVEVSFGSHHWPTWGNQEIVEFWKKQRDVYRYIHDETLRLANQGYNMVEIAEMIELPPSLANTWANRDYYGTVSHNAKAQYQLYYGWFDGNPANLEPLPPVEASKKYVEYMGGENAILTKAQSDFAKGEYRWVAMALNHVVFANPNNQTAKNLLADTYTQLGYQAESGPWRNFYLSGATELRNGVNKVAVPQTGSADIVNNLPLESFLDYLAVRLNGPKAANKSYTFNLQLPDVNAEVAMYLENGVLNYTMGKQEANADTTVIINRQTLNDINLGKKTFPEAVTAGEVQVTGNPQAFADFISLLDTFEFWFNIVTP